MISKLSQALVAFCVATVLTQLILLGYFVTRGSLRGESMTKIVALLNGIDISSSRVQQILRQSEDRQQPDFEEVLDARKLESYDMDLRLRSLKELHDEVNSMLVEARDESERLDERLASFHRELAEIRQGAQRRGLEDVQRTLQSLDADQAKEQLLIMYDDERIDDVVTIVQAMPTDKRREILAEFVDSDEEKGKLAEILRRISEGMPTSSLINRAIEDR